MAVLALFLSLTFVALGAVGVISPYRLLAFVRRFETPAGLYAAAIFRFVLGLALMLAAPASRAPGIISALGIIIFIAGLAAPLIGVERLRRLFAWWSRQMAAFMRAWAGLALVLGLFIAYAVLP